MFVKWLKNLRREDLNMAGSKAANLGEMLKFIPCIPSGFCITVNAFKYFVERHKMYQLLIDSLRKIDFNNPFDLKNTSERIRNFIVSKNIPEEIEEEVSRFYRMMSRNRTEQLSVAVRSSACVEDMPQMSSAGQHDSFLNVKGGSEILQAVKACWASLFTERAVAYRHNHKLKIDLFPISVLIQEMIFSEISGVAFTSHPLSEENNVVVIEASWGIGETIVSGKVTPDHYEINIENKEIKQNIGSKRLRTILYNGELQELAVPEEKQKLSCLKEKQIWQIVDVVKKIELHFQHPQDVEWGIFGNSLYIFQTRPITGLKKSIDRRSNYGVKK